MAPGRNEKRNRENDTYRFQRRHNGQGRPCTAAHNAAISYANRLPAPVDNQS